MKRKFVIDKCEMCGFVSYNFITRCPVCGNMILTAEKLNEEEWRDQKEAGFKTRVKQILDSPVWQKGREDRRAAEEVRNQ